MKGPGFCAIMTPVKRQIRGLSLASLLVLITLLAVLATSMVVMFTANLNLLQASNNGQMALDEAEAGLNQVLLNLAADPSYGSHQETLLRTLNRQLSASECYHQISFDSGQSQVPFSTNAQAGATSGYLGRPVPAECVHVISTGFCRGQVRTLEAIIRQPPFNFALASAGPIQSANPIRVEGIDSRQAYVQGQSKPLPGHIASNSNQGILIQAMTGLNSFISGQARAVGNVDLDPNAVVLQGKRANSSALPLPDINITSFDPLGTAGLLSITTSTSTISNLSATHRSAQSTTFSNGVQFTNGLLYVAGDATFERGLTGSGALIVDGDVTIRGAGTQLSGSDSVAILASGKVTIEGDPAQTVTPSAHANFINGLVYGARGVDLSNLTVAGIVLTQDSQSTTKLTNTNLMYVSDAASLQINIAPSVDGGGSDVPPMFYGSIDASGNFVSMTPGEPGGTLYVGTPPVPTGNFSWSDQLTQAPGGQSLQDYALNTLAQNPAQVQPGRMSGPGGYDATMSTEHHALLADWVDHAVPDANGNLVPGVGGNPVPAADVSAALSAALAGTQPVTQSAWSVTNPGSTFSLDLNNFLPRSSTLKITGLCVHHQKL